MGFFNFLTLEANAKIEYTDSGTNQEVASILGTPCVVTRTCTERPECGDCGTTVLSNPSNIVSASWHVLSVGHKNDFTLGDGKSSERIVEDLVNRLRNEFYIYNSPCVDLYKTRHFKQYDKYSLTGFNNDY